MPQSPAAIARPVRGQDDPAFPCDHVHGRSGRGEPGTGQQLFTLRRIGDDYIPKPLSLVLSVEGKEIHADKEKLAAVSPYFKSLFFGGLAKAGSDVITSEGDCRSFQACLDIYKGERPCQLKTKEDIDDLMAVADFYDFPLVLLACKLSLHLFDSENVKVDFTAEKDLPQFDKKSATSDVVIVIHGQEIHVEKALLSSMSPLFARLFEEEFNQIEHRRIDCSGMVSHKYLLACIQIFCGHTPSVLADPRRIGEILRVADVFDFRVVDVICGIRLVQMSRMDFKRSHETAGLCKVGDIQKDIEWIWRKAHNGWNSDVENRDDVCLACATSAVWCLPSRAQQFVATQSRGADAGWSLVDNVPGTAQQVVSGPEARGYQLIVPVHSVSISTPLLTDILAADEPHLQAALLEKCNVLELYTLATMSRSLSQVAAETMRKRTLESIEIIGDRRFVRIRDVDASRNIDVKFHQKGNGEDKNWSKIQKLMLFCRHAKIEDILFTDQSYRKPVYPMFHLCADYGYAETEAGEMFVSKVVVEYEDHDELLRFVTPLDIELEMTEEDLFVFSSRGVKAAEKVRITFRWEFYNAVVFNRDLLNLRASSITLQLFPGDISGGLDGMKKHYYKCPVRFTPVGVERFIEEWNEGSRAIDHIQCVLPIEECDGYAEEVLLELARRKEKVQTDHSKILDDELRGKLQNLDGKMLYDGELSISPDADVIRVTDCDGRHLTIVISKGWMGEYPAPIGFIDILG